MWNASINMYGEATPQTGEENPQIAWNQYINQFGEESPQTGEEQEAEEGNFLCLECEKPVPNFCDFDGNQILYHNRDGELVCDDCDRVFKEQGCEECRAWFDDRKDFCKLCGFDLNCFNGTAEPDEPSIEEEVAALRRALVKANIFDANTIELIIDEYIAPDSPTNVKN